MNKNAELNKLFKSKICFQVIVMYSNRSKFRLNLGCLCLHLRRLFLRSKWSIAPAKTITSNYQLFPFIRKGWDNHSIWSKVLGCDILCFSLIIQKSLKEVRTVSVEKRNSHSNCEDCGNYSILIFECIRKNHTKWR